MLCPQGLPGYPGLKGDAGDMGLPVSPGVGCGCWGLPRGAGLSRAGWGVQLSTGRVGDQVQGDGGHGLSSQVLGQQRGWGGAGPGWGSWGCSRMLEEAGVSPSAVSTGSTGDPRPDGATREARQEGKCRALSPPHHSVHTWCLLASLTHLVLQGRSGADGARGLPGDTGPKVGPGSGRREPGHLGSP